MNDWPWQELALTPTADRILIRRAYAARLKTIDPDADPDAFMRLRRAYDEAISAAQTLPANPPATTGHDDERPMAPAEESADFARLNDALAAFEERFRVAIDACDTNAAADVLETALTDGVIPVGRGRPHIESLALCALGDSTLDSETLSGLARRFDAAGGPLDGGDSLSYALGGVEARARALAWESAIAATARSGDGWGKGLWRRLWRRDIRVARAIRDQRSRGLRHGDLRALLLELAKAAGHAPWLERRVDPALLERRFAPYRRRTRPRLWRPIAALTLLAMAGGIALTSRYEIAALILADCAFIVLGGWFFPALGLILLGLLGWIVLGS